MVGRSIEYNFACNSKHSHEMISEREKLRKIKRGYREYIEEFTEDIIRKYYDEILHFCVYQLHDIDSAYDITQETFLRFIKNIERLEYKNLKGFLLTVARNLCVDYWKVYKRERAVDFEQNSEYLYLKESMSGDKKCSNGTGSSANAFNSNEAYEQVENSMILLELLAKLPPEQREVIILRYYNDMKLSAISKIQGVSLSTVKSRLRLGMQHMKQFMEATNGKEGKGYKTII